MKIRILSLILAGSIFTNEFVLGENNFDYGITNNNFSNDSDRILLARMIFGEARNCCDEEKILIGYTAINRANDGKRWNGDTLKEVLLKPYQYSCFNKNNVNRKKLMNPEKYEPEAWEKCLFISDLSFENKYPEYNIGATLYHTKTIETPRNWDKNKIVEVNVPDYFKHRFYIDR